MPRVQFRNIDDIVSIRPQTLHNLQIDILIGDDVQPAIVSIG